MLLRDADIDPSESGLNGDVADLMTLATSARALEGRESIRAPTAM